MKLKGDQIRMILIITKSGKPSVIILHAKTLNRKQTIPQGEMDAFREGTIQHKSLLVELEDVVSRDYIFSDSMICIFQLLSEKQHGNVFVNNRVRDIKRDIDVLTKVYHVVSQENLADIGTRYGTSLSDTNFLTCDVVSPTSIFANGKYWFEDLAGAEECGIITSAATLNKTKRMTQFETDQREICLMSNPTVGAKSEINDDVDLPELICEDDEEYPGYDDENFLLQT